MFRNRRCGRGCRYDGPVPEKESKNRGHSRPQRLVICWNRPGDIDELSPSAYADMSHECRLTGDGAPCFYRWPVATLQHLKHSRMKYDGGCRKARWESVPFMHAAMH
jgi:hypothetical protein